MTPEEQDVVYQWFLTVDIRYLELMVHLYRKYGTNKEHEITISIAERAIKAREHKSDTEDGI